ncbi:MAG TPA: hypothetical protein VN426_07125 [Syntrophomonadaceae bacterium]|nr:hypothetical protein [Syntrophomonadaceae bacterium]
MSTFYFFLQGIPESMGIIAISLAVARVPFRWGYILLGGVLLDIVSYIIRSLPVTFGFHLPIMIFLFFIGLVRLTNVTASKAIIAVLTGFFALALLEYCLSNAFFAYTHMDFEQAYANQSLWAAVGVVQALILNVIALVISNFLKPGGGAWKI